MWKKILLLFLITLSFLITNVDIAAAAGLKSYVNTDKGYQFLYPNGWVQVKVSGGPDVVFHDIIETTENVSVIVSPAPSNKTLAELGTPTEVGYKLGKNALAPEGSGRKAELVDASERQVEDKTYYMLEYVVKLPNNKKRHNLASVALRRGKVFTLNASVSQRRWPRVKRLIEDTVSSFSVY